MTQLQKYKLYISTIVKYYFGKVRTYLRGKSNLFYTVWLSAIVFVWFWLIISGIINNPSFKLDRFSLIKLGNSGTGLWILFVKPIFVYIAGIIIINKSKNQ
ncbi:hypothetical protein HQ571_04610 [Candidatus Kuenenbacteria bacterium]|nr:hypothetical protein [Candidatus Kuenenbacteria bacterium]